MILKWKLYGAALLGVVLYTIAVLQYGKYLGNRNCINSVNVATVKELEKDKLQDQKRAQEAVKKADVVSSNARFAIPDAAPKAIPIGPPGAPCIIPIAALSPYSDILIFY